MIVKVKVIAQDKYWVLFLCSEAWNRECWWPMQEKMIYKIICSDIYNNQDCESENDCTKQRLGFYLSAQRLEIGNADCWWPMQEKIIKRLFAMIFAIIRIVKVKVTAQDKYWVLFLCSEAWNRECRPLDTSGCVRWGRIGMSIWIWSRGWSLVGCWENIL